MSKEAIRALDPQAVEAAEYVRKNDKVAQAAEIAARALGFPDNPLSDEEITQICQDPEQRAILACLARIHVDALKSMANFASTAHGVLSPLSQATKTINSIERNAYFKTSIAGIEKDHLSRTHHFEAEIPRDIAKVTLSASVLYSKKDSDELIEYGEMLLEQTYTQLPKNHPTKPLIGVELGLSRLGRGKEIDEDELIANFIRLRDVDEKVNPHRVATVASWFVVVGEANQNEKVKELGWETYERLINKHPEWDFMVSKERKKRRLRETRKKVIRLLAQVTTTPGERKKLFEDILAK